MKELSWGAHSRNYPAPARGDLPVIYEEGFDTSHLDVHRRWIELFRSLPPPFQRVLEAQVDETGVKLWLARFIGVDGLDLMRSLESTGRVLPVDVWLALASAWGEALVHVPADNDGWRTAIAIHQLGVDVRGELILTFDEPNLVLGRNWVDPASLTRAGGYRRIPESISPEAVRGLPLTEAARVYSLGVAMLGLLEGRRMFSRHESMIAMLGDIALTGLTWGTPRNPQCTPGLEDVLRRATAREPADRFQTIGELLTALRATRLEAASPTRMMDVLLGVSPLMLTCLEKVEESSLPPSWRAGGLQVLQDRLLERLVPITALPLAR